MKTEPIIIDSKEYKVGLNGRRGLRVNIPLDIAKWAGMKPGSTVRFVWHTSTKQLVLEVVSKENK